MTARNATKRQRIDKGQSDLDLLMSGKAESYVDSPYTRESWYVDSVEGERCAHLESAMRCVHLETTIRKCLQRLAEVRKFENVHTNGRPELFLQFCSTSGLWQCSKYSYNHYGRRSVKFCQPIKGPDSWNVSEVEYEGGLQKWTWDRKPKVGNFVNPLDLVCERLYVMEKAKFYAHFVIRKSINTGSFPFTVTAPVLELDLLSCKLVAIACFLLALKFYVGYVPGLRCLIAKLEMEDCGLTQSQIIEKIGLFESKILVMMDWKLSSLIITPIDQVFQEVQTGCNDVFPLDIFHFMKNPIDKSVDFLVNHDFLYLWSCLIFHFPYHSDEDEQKNLIIQTSKVLSKFAMGTSTPSAGHISRLIDDKEVFSVDNYLRLLKNLDEITLKSR